MQIAKAFDAPAARSEVVAFLLDIERMATCIPGVTEVRRIADGRYEATLVASVGPIRTRFKGRIEMDESTAPERISALAEGTDENTGSTAIVAFAADFIAVASFQTRVETVADVTIRGRLGQFGTAVIMGVADAMLDEFTACLARQLGEEGPADRPVGRPVGAWQILRAAWLGLWRRIHTAINGLRYRRRNQRGR